jgi:hypothetical protein
MSVWRLANSFRAVAPAAGFHSRDVTADNQSNRASRDRRYSTRVRLRYFLMMAGDGAA